MINTLLVGQTWQRIRKVKVFRMKEQPSSGAIQTILYLTESRDRRDR